MIFHPVYSFVKHTRLDETVKVKPTKVIILEGILIFENRELCDLMDIKVFVDTDGDVRIIRRLLRDVQERGRDLDSVVNQYLGTVKPMHEEFVDPSKKRADIIIPEGGANTVALSMLLERIKSFMNEN
jgi:uridine kinase